MGDIILIETEERDFLDRMTWDDASWRDSGIDMIVVLPPIVYIGKDATERLKEYKKIIDKALE